MVTIPGKRLLVLFAALGIAGCSSAPDAAPSPTASVGFETLGIPHSSAPLPDIFCSGQPSEAQLAELAKAGVRRVVCLRPADEPGTGWEEAKAGAAGIQFVRIPVAGEQDIDEAHARALDAQLRDGGGATLVCCGSSNRVGALMALRAHFVEGRSAEESLALGKACGLKKAEPRVVELLGK